MHTLELSSLFCQVISMSLSKATHNYTYTVKSRMMHHGALTR